MEICKTESSQQPWFIKHKPHMVQYIVLQAGRTNVRCHSRHLITDWEASFESFNQCLTRFYWNLDRDLYTITGDKVGTVSPIRITIHMTQQIYLSWNRFRDFGVVGRWRKTFVVFHQHFPATGAHKPVRRILFVLR